MVGEASFVWRRVQDLFCWQKTDVEVCSGSCGDFAEAGASFLLLAQHLQSQCDLWWQYWQLREYGQFACVVSAHWAYPQRYLVQRVAVAFLAGYLVSQDRVPNAYPESRVMGEKLDLDLESDYFQEEVSSLLSSAHSENITAWTGLIVRFVKVNQEISFSQLCSRLADQDWGDDVYSKAKVYLGLLLAEEFSLQSLDDDFYGDFQVVRKEPD